MGKSVFGVKTDIEFFVCAVFHALTNLYPSNFIFNLIHPVRILLCSKFECHMELLSETFIIFKNILDIPLRNYSNFAKHIVLKYIISIPFYGRIYQMIPPYLFWAQKLPAKTLILQLFHTFQHLNLLYAVYLIASCNSY